MLTWHADCSPAAHDRRSTRLKSGNSYKGLPDLPAASAKAAGLRYVSDAVPGIRRLRCGPAFRYVHADGRPVRDRDTLSRIRALAIPPAWQAVRNRAQDDGHLQATGLDALRRKQYRYHRRWHEVRDDTKYGRMVPFARALPRIRRRLERDLALHGLPREKVLATVVRLLETTLIRVGNEAYARDNDSFGLTTLRERQVRVRGGKLKFQFRGKSGVHHDIELTDRRLAAIVRRMQDLPGEELFQYVDEGGETHGIESADVNAYLKEISGDDFTSKDFRTWAGTVLAARALKALKPFASQSEARRNVVQAIEGVAKALGNTKAVCRKCYVHPAILDTYMEGELLEGLQRRREEAAVLAVLQARRRREREPNTGVLLRRSLAAAARRLQRKGMTSSSQTATRGAA
jgi:DNA topoisomerase-1